MMRVSIALLAGLLAAGSAKAEESVTLTTLEWCPYVCADAADGGFSSVVVREAFKSMGYALTYQVLPWQRAVATAKSGETAVGYYPEYPGEVEGFTLSDSIGDGPLGLIAPPGKTIADVSPAGLATMKLGVVNGYINAAPVAKAIADGLLKPEGAVDDATNIKKVAAGRIEAAEIDRYVFSHLMRTEKQLEPLKGKVEFVTTLENKTLHVAFNQTEKGKKMAAIFAEGLKKLDLKALQSRYFAQLGSLQ